MRKNLLSMWVLAVAALGFSPAQADGVAKAKRGGVVQKANDITYELVALADTVHAANALFDAHRVPRHVEVDDDVAELQVQTFTTGIRRN